MKNGQITQFCLIAFMIPFMALVTSLILPEATPEQRTLEAIEVGVNCAEVAIKYQATGNLIKSLGEVPLEAAQDEVAAEWVGTPLRALHVAFVANSITLDEYLMMSECLPALEQSGTIKANL